MFKKISFAVLVLLSLVAMAIFAQSVPGLINYQGRLLDDAGQPLNGDTLDLHFTMLDGDTPGSGLLWGETHTNVVVENGLYGVILGSINPIPASALSGSTVFMEIEVEGQILLPRQRLTSVAYSINSGMVGGYARSDIDALIAGLQSQIDALDGRVGVNETDVSSNTTNIADNTSDLALLDPRVEDNETKLEDVSVAGTDVIFSNVNVHIRSGSGSTNGTINGLGNLIIGYNEDNGDIKTGSHNLVLGMDHTYSSFAGLVAGRDNEISGPNASVSGGFENIASGTASSVSGGRLNQATYDYTSVSGGKENIASAAAASVSGGSGNEAAGRWSTINGGQGNYLSRDYRATLAAEYNYEDLDGDGHFRLGAPFEPADDCMDVNPAIAGGMIEICDSIDNQCPGYIGSGYVDEGCTGGDDFPEFISKRDPGFSMGIFVLGDYAYTAEAGLGMAITDVSDPENPVTVGSYDTSGYGVDIFAEGDYAYLADGSGGLKIFDVSTPSSPSKLGTYSTSGAEDVLVEGQYAYLADGSNGLKIIDISTPATPSLVGSYNSLSSSSQGIAKKGDYVYLANYLAGLVVMDVSTPAAPSFVRTKSTASTMDVTVCGDYAYTASYGLGMYVLDLSNPANPSIVGSLDTPGSAYGVHCLENTVFIADYNKGLRVINVEDPTSPVEIGFFDTNGDSEDVFALGGYVYVADHAPGFKIFRLRK